MGIRSVMFRTTPSKRTPCPFFAINYGYLINVHHTTKRSTVLRVQLQYKVHGTVIGTPASYLVWHTRYCTLLLVLRVPSYRYTYNSTHISCTYEYSTSARNMGLCVQSSLYCWLAFLLRRSSHDSVRIVYLPRYGTCTMGVGSERDGKIIY